MFIKKYYLLRFSVLIALSFLLNNSLFAQSDLGLHPKTEQFANEVYQDCLQYVNEELLGLYDKLVRRVEIVQFQNNQLNDIKLLSSFGLKNKCNASLSYDGVNFIPENFNPLKYFLNYSSTEDQYIRVDNTNYVVHILPQ